MIIDGVYLLMAPRFKKKNIQFQKEFAEDLPQVYVDESQLEQVVLNLFLNAVDAMPEGGKLSVHTGQRKPDKSTNTRLAQAEVFVSIADTGKGIPEQKLEKIFNPFYTTKSDGVGLGLSISSRLLEENGGTIEVQSELAKGSEFNIFLPTAKQ
jgi:signal transduction histidine kinase